MKIIMKKNMSLFMLNTNAWLLFVIKFKGYFINSSLVMSDVRCWKMFAFSRETQSWVKTLCSCIMGSVVSSVNISSFDFLKSPFICLLTFAKIPPSHLYLDQLFLSYPHMLQLLYRFHFSFSLGCNMTSICVAKATKGNCADGRK